MPVDPMTGEMLPYEDEGLDMMAMESMLGPGDPMGGMGGDMEMVDIQVPAYAVAAVMELVAMLEEEMNGGGMDMGGMPPMDAGMDPMMGGGMPPMM